MEQFASPKQVWAEADVAADIKDAAARLYRRVRSERTDSELGGTASSVLGYLVKHGPQTPRALSDRESVTPPAMNQTVNALEAAGYVTRSPDPTDGRKVLVTSTERGTALVAELGRERRDWLNSRIAQLSESERHSLVEAARIMQELADS